MNGLRWLRVEKLRYTTEAATTVMFLAEDHSVIKPGAYLDTSVLSAYTDHRAPERQRFTQTFWVERLPHFDAAISEVVLDEMSATPDPTRRKEMEALAEGFNILLITEEVQSLAQEYVKSGIFQPRASVDAVHLAVAVTNNVEYLVSWNFRDLVNVSTRRQVNLVNSLKGFEPVEIVAPPEL